MNRTQFTYLFREKKGSHSLVVLVMCSVLLCFFSCSRQPTTWEVDIALPLVDDLLDWTDVIGDSLATVESGSVAVIRFDGVISELDIEALTQLPDTLVAQELTPDFSGGPFQVPPGAVLLNTQEDIVFQGIDQQFKSIVLESGRIEYSVESSTDGYVEMQYDFPSVTVDGESVELYVLLPPSGSGQFQTETGVIDLSGASIDLTGVSGNEINRIASELVIGTPAFIEDTAQVYGSDSILVSMHFKDLLVQQVSGYFGQEMLDFDVEQKVFDSAVFTGGFLEINPSRAMLSFNNTLAADIRLDLDALQVDGIGVGHPQLGTPQFISRADWSSGEVQPGEWNMDLLESGPAIFELLGYLPEFVTMQGEGLLNPLGDVSGGQDFFDARQPPQLQLDLEWPLKGAIEQFGVSQTFDFGGLDVPQFEGDLVLRLTNGFPVSWEFNAEWVNLSSAFVPEYLDGTVPSFFDESGDSHVIEWRIPISDLRLSDPSQLIFSARMDSDGDVVFTGNERLRLQVAIEGTHQVTVE
ncbi:hypothetical protein N8891_05325 [Flavobacteriales bacterium]|nr:hypothetical protein [Flavobacteriales bacterium]